MDLMLIYIVILVFILIVFSTPTIINELKLRRRSRNDFLSARGTLHSNIIHNGLVSLDRVVYGLEREAGQLDSRRIILRNERKKALEAKLTSQIVDKELEGIPGIGRVLKERIIRECFDGTLESLNAVGNVQGIGDEKMHAIDQWIKEARLKMPGLLLGDFLGKSDIVGKYADSINKIEQELITNNSECQALQQLKSEAVAALDRLGSVDVSTFIDANRGDGRASEMVTRYLIGAFPEWREMPEWFKTLVEKYGMA